MTGAKQIEQERQRQIEQEGYTAEHDDRHSAGQLAYAAASYCVEAVVGGEGYRHEVVRGVHRFVPLWPFDRAEHKGVKHSRKRLLIIAGAMIAAEIDRLERIEKTEQ